MPNRGTITITGPGPMESDIRVVLGITPSGGFEMQFHAGVPVTSFSTTWPRETAEQIVAMLTTALEMPDESR